MILSKDLKIQDLVELFSDNELSVSNINTLFSFNNPSLNYPLLPKLLLDNGKIDCLVEYLSHIKNIDYLMINFFTNNTNIPTEVMSLSLPYIDNFLSISLDKLNFDYFISLNQKFPHYIGEHTILKLIKIYDNDQKHFFKLEKFEEVEFIIINDIFRGHNNKFIFDKIDNYLNLIPLYLKIAENSFEDTNLNFLDLNFKKLLPSYMHHYIEKLKLNRSLNSKHFETNYKVNSQKI